ncbi:MAG: flagellar export chaperone FliS [Gammaproteobacteria bacterium]|nr:flagellar export chaperone FliS [Gammaproteobacteria bacterium]
MYASNGAAQYRAVRGQGVVGAATPTRLIQVALEGVLSHLAIAQGCMERIQGNLPLAEVTAKCNAIHKAVLLLGHLDECLDRERGGEVADNLHKLYQYMLGRLTEANAGNDAAIVREVADLVRTLKSGWDQLVAEGR